MAVNTIDPDVTLPWYREFWAWFVFAPLIIIIIACAITVTIAVKYRDDVVVDNYYKVGKMLAQDMNPSKVAKDLGITVDMRVLSPTKIALHFNRQQPAQRALLFVLSHPSTAALDREIRFQVTDKNHLLELDTPLRGRWYARISAYGIADANAPEKRDRDIKTPGLGDEIWRVQSEIDLRSGDAFMLQ